MDAFRTDFLPKCTFFGPETLAKADIFQVIHLLLWHKLSGSVFTASQWIRNLTCSHTLKPKLYTYSNEQRSACVLTWDQMGPPPANRVAVFHDKLKLIPERLLTVKPQQGTDSLILSVRGKGSLRAL
jgi:hypothetical protein